MSSFFPSLTNLFLRSPPVLSSPARASGTSFLLQAWCTTSSSSHSSWCRLVHWTWIIIPPLQHSFLSQEPYWQTLTHSPAKRSSLTYPFPPLFPTPGEVLLASSHGCHRCLCWKSLLSIWLPAEKNRVYWVANPNTRLLGSPLPWQEEIHS